MDLTVQGEKITKALEGESHQGGWFPKHQGGDKFE